MRFCKAGLTKMYQILSVFKVVSDFAYPWYAVHRDMNQKVKPPVRNRIKAALSSS